MGDFMRQRSKRQEDNGLGSVLDVLLANARLVLGVTGAAVLAIATLAVKRVRVMWASLGLRDGEERCFAPQLQNSLDNLLRMMECHGNGAAHSHPAGTWVPHFPGAASIWDIVFHPERHLGFSSSLET